MSISNFSIQGSSVTSTLYKGTSRQFTFLVDEPNELGGEDLAANPVEYLLAAYAGCINVVINLIGKELDVQLNSIKINIDGDLDAARLLGHNSKERAGFQSLNVHIDFETNAPQERIDLLFNSLKQRCPVSDNLSNTTPIHYHINKLSQKEQAYA